jgi:hypothetical protein
MDARPQAALFSCREYNENQTGEKRSQANLAMLWFVDRRSLSGTMSRQVWRTLYQRIDNPSEHGLKMSVGK